MKIIPYTVSETRGGMVLSVASNDIATEAIELPAICEEADDTEKISIDPQV